MLSAFQTILQHWRDRVDIEGIYREEGILENTGWREYWRIQGVWNTGEYRVEGIVENTGRREYWRIQGGGNTGEYRVKGILENTGWREYWRIQGVYSENTLKNGCFYILVILNYFYDCSFTQFEFC